MSSAAVAPDNTEPQSQVEKNFVDKKTRIPLGDALRQSVVPGLGKVMCARLSSKDGFAITNFGQLLGHFLLGERDVGAFIDFFTTQAVKAANNLDEEYVKTAAAAFDKRVSAYDFLSQVDTQPRSTNTSVAESWKIAATKLPKGPLVERVIPELGTTTIAKLTAAGTHSFDQLSAQWFLNGRTAEGLQKWLLSKDVLIQQARPIAEALHAKMNVQPW